MIAKEVQRGLFWHVTSLKCEGFVPLGEDLNTLVDVTQQILKTPTQTFHK